MNSSNIKNQEETSKMRFRKWLIISCGLHLMVGAAYTVSILANQNYEDMTAVELQASPHKKNQDTPPLFADEGSQAKKKPTIETNKQPVAQEEAGNDSGEYVDFFRVEELPVALSPINPVYPEDARRQGIEGRVIMQVYIDASGTVQKVDILKSPNSMLADSAQKAVISTKFRPARLNGAFKRVRMQLTLRFHLE